MSKKIEDEKNKENRVFWFDVKYTIGVLHRMHNAFEEFEPLSESLQKEAEEAMFLIANWSTNNKKINDMLMELLYILDDQLTFNQKLKARKEYLYNEYLDVLHGKKRSATLC